MPGRGHFQLAFGIFLALGVMLSGWPMLRHVQQQIALEARAKALLNRPLEAEIAELLLRVRRLSAQAGAYHGMLEAAEAHLWEFKNIRESSLILKDVGNDDGELGLRALKAAYPKATGNLARLNLALAQAEREWKVLRDQASPERFREVGRGLSEVARVAKRQEQLLERYREVAEETGARVAQFSRLAPQVAGKVPESVGELAGQLQRLRATISQLGDALGAFSREVPADPAKP